MSKAQFVECHSQDPVIRALARKAVRLLNDPSLDRQQREAKVRSVQRDIICHQEELAAAVAKQAAKVAAKASTRTRHTHGHPNGAIADAKQVAARRREFINTPVKNLPAEPTAVAAAATKSPLSLFNTTEAANDGGHRTLHLNKAQPKLLAA